MSTREENVIQNTVETTDTTTAPAFQKMEQAAEKAARAVQDAMNAAAGSSDSAVKAASMSMDSAAKHAADAAKRIQTQMDSVGGTKTSAMLNDVEKAVERLNKTAAKKGGFGDVLKGALEGLKDGAKEFLASEAGGAAVAGATGGFAALIGEKAIEKLVEGMEKLGEAFSETTKRSFELRESMLDSKSMGMTLEQTERLEYASKRLGFEQGSLTYVMRSLSDQMTLNESLFRRLGVATRDSNGEMRSTGDVLEDLFDVFQRTENSTERMRLASELFGGRMGTRLIPLLMMGKKALRELGEEGVRSGNVLDEQGEKKMLALADATTRANLAWEGLHNRFQMLLVGPLTAVANVMERVAHLGQVIADLFKNDQSGMDVETPGMKKNKADFAAWEEFAKRKDLEARGGAEFVQAMREASDAVRDAHSKTETFGQAFVKVEQQCQAALRPFVDLRREAMKFDFTDPTKQAFELFTNLHLTGAEIAKIAAMAPDMQALGRVFGDSAIAVSEMFSGIMGKAESSATKVALVTKALHEMLHPVRASEQQALFDGIAKTAVNMEEAGRSDSAVLSFILNRVNGSVEKAKLVFDAMKRLMDKSEDIWRDWKNRTSPLEQFDMKVERTSAFDEEQRRARTEAKLGGQFEDNGKSRGFNSKGRNSSPQAMYKTLEALREQVKDSASWWNGLVNGFSDAMEKMSSVGDQFISGFMDRMFASKSVWAQVWRSLTETALQQLNRILIHKAFMLVLDAAMKLLGSPFSASDIKNGGGIDDVVKNGASAGPTVANTTVNNVTIQSFSPRDVVGELTLPGGSLRRANTRVALAREY